MSTIRRQGAPPSGEPLLTVEDLQVSFATEEGVVQAVEGVSFDLAPGEILAVVGESGSGKSVTAMTLMGLTRSPNADFEGTAHYKGTELIARVRGPAPAGARRGDRDDLPGPDDVAEPGPEDRRPDRRADPGARGAARQAGARAGDRAARAGSGIPRARERIDNYPFEFSGGMRQRVMIALALSCNPSVLIADEPTTALDVTIQAQILQRMRELRDETGAAIILVTHDLGVVADIADRIAVMYSGPDRGAGHARRDLLRPAAPLHVGAARLDRAGGPAAARAAAGDRRAAAVAGRPARGLPLPAALPARVREVRGGAAARGAPGRPARAHCDRCWLTPEEKRERREVRPGEIGLEAKSEAGAS